ncbi:hypothetical protein AB0J55_17625 [Amycolatopsis sp. NPDC049688]|uniref:hypothetical protein n=1 Tax=Amycolatopsis sp. NPDC049688 TaxID=3154733 RepID=UPI0034484266
MTEYSPRDLAAVDLLADLEEITRENRDMCLDEIAGHLADRRWRRAPHEDQETDAEREARFDAAALDVVARLSTGDPAHPFPYISEMAEGQPRNIEPLPFTSDDVGERLRFPLTGGVYRIIAVDETDRMITIEAIGHPDDRTTESFADVLAADAEVLRG